MTRQKTSFYAAPLVMSLALLVMAMRRLGILSWERDYYKAIADEWREKYQARLWRELSEWKREQ